MENVSYLPGFLTLSLKSRSPGVVNPNSQKKDEESRESSKDSESLALSLWFIQGSRPKVKKVVKLRERKWNRRSKVESPVVKITVKRISFFPYLKRTRCCVPFNGQTPQFGIHRRSTQEGHDDTSKNPKPGHRPVPVPGPGRPVVHK